MAPIRVRLVTHRGIIEYGARLVDDDGRHLIVEAVWTESTGRDIGPVRFERGDLWTEHYWRDRWYSVKQVTSAGGVPRGWYCDAARPAELADGILESVDLELDLWVSADREVVVRLDEDEFLAWVVSRDPEAAKAALQGIDELETSAREGRSPFVGVATD